MADSGSEVDLIERRSPLARNHLRTAEVLSKRWAPVALGWFPAGEAMLIEALSTGRKEDPGGLWESQPLYALASLRGSQGDPAGAKAYGAQMIEVASG